MITISFVIPVFNEELRIKKTFKALNKLSVPRGLRLQEIIFVDDGSTDKTVECIKCYVSSKKKKEYLILSYQQNRGKGYALRQGMLASNSDYTLFFDADISTPLSEIAKFVPYIEANTDAIIGTRKNGKSKVIKHQPLYREVLGKCFTIFTQIVFGVIATDFTCGFKAFSKRAKSEIFSNSKINRWGFDVEVLILANLFKFTSVETAVTWADEKKSRVKLYKDIPLTLLELGHMFLLYKILPLLRNIRNLYSKKIFRVPYTYSRKIAKLIF